MASQYKEFCESLAELGRVEANRPTRELQLSFHGTRDLQSWSDGQHISKSYPPTSPG